MNHGIKSKVTRERNYSDGWPSRKALGMANSIKASS